MERGVSICATNLKLFATTRMSISDGKRLSHLQDETSQNSSLVSIYATLMLASLSLGYYAGGFVSRRKPTSSTLNVDTLASHHEPDALEDLKLVLVVRTDLKMSTGKIAAQ